MKIAVCSDLHLEFDTLSLKNTEGANVLILSGDIMLAAGLLKDEPCYRQRYQKFFEQVGQEFPVTFYVMGNHEHYHYCFDDTEQTIRDFLLPFGNIHLLEKQAVDIHGVTFLGGTMWTYMNNCDVNTMTQLRFCMNDFRIVTKNTKYGRSTLSPEDVYKEHLKTVSFIESTVDLNPQKKFVVVTHHQPSLKALNPKYKDDYVLNAGYYSNMDEFIEKRPQIKAWTSGHTHQRLDFMIGDTRMLTNARGYAGREYMANDFTLKYFEV